MSITSSNGNPAFSTAITFESVSVRYQLYQGRRPLLQDYLSSLLTQRPLRRDVWALRDTQAWSRDTQAASCDTQAASCDTQAWSRDTQAASRNTQAASRNTQAVHGVTQAQDAVWHVS